MSPRSASPLTLIRQRRHRRDKTRRGVRQGTRRLAFGSGFVVSAALVLLLLAAALTYASLTRNLPPVEALEAQLNPSTGLLLQPTRLYDRTGQHLLATLAPVDALRTYIPYEQFPQAFVNATLALTQPDFWDSPGYVLSGWQDPASHPTLAQQLVSDLLLADELPGSLRGIHARLLAAQVTARYGREQVIEWYLNSVDYGHYAYGAEAAAQLYFGKSITQVSLSEAALLAAVGRAPALNPLDAPQAADSNRVATLLAMRLLGWITPEESGLATNEVPVILPPAGVEQNVISREFIDLALRQLAEATGAQQVIRGGALILTTIDYGLQLQAECALRAQLGRLSGNQAPVSAADGSVCDTAALLPVVLEGGGDTQVIAGALVLDPATGQILAAAGNLLPHPAGTTITPFVYLTGFARGLNPASLGWDLPGDEPVLGQVYQGPVRLRVALANDYLPPAVTVLEQMGIESVRTTAASFGLDLPSEDLMQEDFDVSPFELTSAYAVLAAQGLQSGQGASSADIEPAAIFQVRRADGSLWLDWSLPQTRLVVSQQLAFLMNHVLGDEAARWPSLGHPNPLEIDRPAAVKAARSLDETGAWTVGYTPQRVVAVYLAGAGSGSRAAADELWGALTRFAVQGLQPVGWEMPAGVVTMKVCDPSGLLPTEACPNVVDEVFLEGRQPTQADTLYQAFEINIETGLLATVFTPPELVESRVYLVTPPEARPWAAAAGIDVQPATFDTFQAPEISPTVHITTPAMFSDGHGTLEISGTAAGANFVSYRLEYGAGLNPQRWTLLGGDVTTPVTNGRLASWDTNGLNGLFVLRLMVVRIDNRVDQAVAQVTLDNTPPQVVIAYPLDGQELSLAKAAQIAIQAQVQDAFLTEVVFYIGGEEVGSLSRAPFGVVWQAETGEHVLRVTAADRVGNVGEAQIRFTVRK